MNFHIVVKSTKRDYKVGLKVKFTVFCLNLLRCTKPKVKGREVNIKFFCWKINGNGDIYQIFFKVFFAILIPSPYKIQQSCIEPIDIRILDIVLKQKAISFIFAKGQKTLNRMIEEGKEGKDINLSPECLKFLCQYKTS